MDNNQEVQGRIDEINKILESRRKLFKTLSEDLQNADRESDVWANAFAQRRNISDEIAELEAELKELTQPKVNLSNEVNQEPKVLLRFSDDLLFNKSIQEYFEEKTGIKFDPNLHEIKYHGADDYGDSVATEIEIIEKKVKEIVYSSNEKEQSINNKTKEDSDEKSKEVVSSEESKEVDEKVELEKSESDKIKSEEKKNDEDNEESLEAFREFIKGVKSQRGGRMNEDGKRPMDEIIDELEKELAEKEKKAGIVWATGGSNLIIDGKKEYSKLNLLGRYAMKLEAYKQENPGKKISLLTKVRVLLPSRKYRRLAESRISNCSIKIDEILNSERENQNNEKIENDDIREHDPFMKLSYTPSTSKSSSQKSSEDNSKKDKSDDEMSK